MIEVSAKTVNLKHIKLQAKQIVDDYRIAFRSRQASLVGRKEVMGGKAKFGIFGDGKEVPQVALAHAFQPGDLRSGYYRDQTLWFALGVYTVEEFFAQLYAHADVKHDPASAGRQMNSHMATRVIDDRGNWRNLTDTYYTSADLSPTGSQMPRLVGLGYASKLFRELEALHNLKEFSNNGNEVAFGMIGNASCAEGMFWESVNAIGVLKTPTVICIWDDDYGISVPNEYQISKANLSELLKGFQRKRGTRDGFDIYRVKGWDYAEMVDTFQKATDVARKEHVPSIVHVVEITQPQGHSTSGSHERYKSRERLSWEKEHDGIRKMREWIISSEIASSEELDMIEAEEIQNIEDIRDASWKAFLEPIEKERQNAVQFIEQIANSSAHAESLVRIKNRLLGILNPLNRDLMAAASAALRLVKDEKIAAKQALIDWKNQLDKNYDNGYGKFLYSESENAAVRIPEIKPIYSDQSPLKNGFEVLNACFDLALERDPRIVAFGEDVGYLGDVNQGFKGLQAKHGELRVSDTGIRECTIIGQAIGLAMRGLRPIAEIQYLDYLPYALQIISDDLATVHWRSAGGQKAPVIIRTRGHRLEGIWHAGSPMGSIIHMVRGIHVLVPRNMVQAAGFYNLLLKSDDPGLIVEVLNGYRLKERLPDNIGEFTVSPGVPDILKDGSDITLVTYGACCRLAMEAAEALKDHKIDVEVIDVQSLLPFDIPGIIGKSLEKTNRILFLDEDVPGGATSYMMQEVLERQGGYRWLDADPKTLTAKPHRPAFGSDGDYWSKPNTETIFEAVYDMMHESDPDMYPIFYK